MSRLLDLVCEVRNGLEIYYSGRANGKYYKTAFILCDDYSELLSKLYLLDHDPAWNETGAGPGARFKSYTNVLGDVLRVLTERSPEDVPRFSGIRRNLEERRALRNKFFHKADLLNLNLNQRQCIGAFLGLLAYGQLLYKDDWDEAIERNRGMETFTNLLWIEAGTLANPIWAKRLNDILQNWPRHEADQPVPEKGIQTVSFPDDLHLRLCALWGGDDFRDEIMGLAAEIDHVDGL
jgi:hypothetical protein